MAIVLNKAIRGADQLIATMVVPGELPQVLVGTKVQSTAPNRSRHPFIQFAAVGVLGMMLIGIGSLVASRRAGEAEAMAEVREVTALVAQTVVAPNVSRELLDGDVHALTELDRLVSANVINETTVRVKLWNAEGMVIYSDETRLIGESYALDDDKQESLWTGLVVSEISSLEGPENRFEQDQGQLLEVYLPIEGPDGQPLLYESYFAMSEVTESSSRIRSAFAPIIIGSLFIMETMHLLLAWFLSRRLRRGQQERERLLRRAIDSSNLERRRIASDLHDGVVQDLVGTSLAITAAAETATQQSPVLAGDLRAAAVGTRKSLTSLRTLLVDIYPPNLSSHGLEVAIVDLLSVPSGAGIVTDLSVTGDVDRSIAAAELTFRVVQEAVRNAVRHGQPDSLSVRLSAKAGCLISTVTDDGGGFDLGLPRADGHLGLRFLADLAADSGAMFSVNSAVGLGTTVYLEVPQ